jgi:hypothetical protein
MRKINLLFAGLVFILTIHAQNKKVLPGADEKTPSKAMYFDWINSEWPGGNEQKTLTNLDFFKWMKDTYGMQLDIYHMDAGNIDQSPNFAEGARSYEEGLRAAYGSLGSDRFKKKYPNGFQPIASKAKEMGCGIGVWLGPDGFGDTEDDAKQRIDLLVSLVKDYGFTLFKFDACVSQLREDKAKYFIKAMTECRKIQPNLIALNHRIKLNADSKEQMTTFLWEGAETYIDVHMTNDICAPHHRAQAMNRYVPPALQRLCEDHGVCISSCLDYWEDDLILQAFNRNLILAPEIYGNPWLLSDKEFARLAHIFNLHRRYNDILVNGMQISEQVYGPVAVARGDKSTRLLAMRNLTWEPVKRKVMLNSTIGLVEKGATGMVDVRVLFPYEKYLGSIKYGLEVEVEVLPFRSCLLLVTTKPEDNFYLWGCNYEVMRDMPGKPVSVKIYGMPGDNVSFRLEGLRKFTKATLDGKDISDLLKGRFTSAVFDGTPYKNNYHRRLGLLKPIAVPADAEALYDATCFSADNNALEVRPLMRSGETSIPQVKAARDAFFNDVQFKSKGIWDKNVFDGDPATFFAVKKTNDEVSSMIHGALRLDCGKEISADKIIVRSITENDNFKAIEVSTDLKTWKNTKFSKTGKDLTIEIPAGTSFRYLRTDITPTTMTEIEGYKGTQKLDRTGWRCSNLFKSYSLNKALSAWSLAFKLDELPKGSYLAVTIPKRYGNEGAYAALRVGGNPVGAPDRAPSYESNVFEYVVKRVDGFYTYYIPLSKDMIGKQLEAVVLGLKPGMELIAPEVYITAYPIPFEEKELILE